jgi:4-amino-4-deoxy-L-arabinose transferase-like glycosyltransferase
MLFGQWRLQQKTLVLHSGLADMFHWNGFLLLAEVEINYEKPQLVVAQSLPYFNLSKCAMPQVSYWRIAFLSLIVVSVTFVELGSARLWDRDEPRNARASHEMLARGDWIVPTFNGSLRDHKPILIYWGQMLSYLALGESEFSARLPSALCALMAIAAVAVLATRLSGKQRGISPEGFWAAGCMATCTLFVMAGRAATPDACLIAFSTLGIAAMVIGSLAPSVPYSSGQVGKSRWILAMFGYTMLGLAALAKGPVGIVLPLDRRPTFGG